MVEELKLAIKIDDATIEQSLLKQFANAQKMANKVVLDFKNVNFDDKQIEAKFKEMQKKAGQNPIDFSISGNTLDMLGQIDKRLTEIFSIGKGKSFIDSSSTVADIDKIENKINELNKKINTSFDTKNKTEAYNQLKKYADAFKDYYNNEEAMASESGTKAAYAYYKAYEEALKKEVAQSKLEKVTVDFDINDKFFDKNRIVSDRIKEYANYKKYGSDNDLLEEISSLKNKLFDFNSAYSQVKEKLGQAAITPEIIKSVERYVELLDKARFLEQLNDPDNNDTIKSHRAMAQVSLDDALFNAQEQSYKYTKSLRQQEEQLTSTVEAEQKLAEVQKETTSNSVTSDNSQIEELKSDIQEVKTELGDVKDRISSIESNGFENVRDDVEKTKESVKELNSELAEMKSNLSSTPQESNISSGDSSTTSTIDKQLFSTKKLIDEEEKLSNIQNKIISFKPQNNDTVINEKTEETLQKSSEYASELLETAQQIVRLANNNVGFVSSEDATEIEKLYQLFPELRDFRYNDMSLDFMSKSDLDEGWMDAFMDFSATLPKAAEYFEMIDEFSSHLSDDGRFWGNEQDFTKDFLHVNPDALDRIAEVNNALNEALGTEEDYTSKYKEIGQKLKDGSIDIQDAIRDILQLEFPNNKIMETPDGVWVAPEKLNKTTKSIKDVSSAVSDVSNKVLQFPGRNVVSEQNKIQEELQQTQDEIDSTQSKYQSLLDVAKKQLDDDKGTNYYSGKTTETKAFDNFTFNEQAKRNGYFDVWSNDYEELIALMDKTEEELKSGSIGFDEAIDRMVVAYQKYDTATKIDVGGFDFLNGLENVPSVLSDTEKAVLNENKAIKESEYTLQDYINTYLELKKVKESSLSVDSKITGVTSNGRPIIKDGSDESFKAELMMKDMEFKVLQIYGKDLSALADEHIKASESAKEHAKVENQVTQAIKESSSTASQDKRKDAFPDKDVSAFVESATNSIKEENNVLEQNTQKVKENTQAKEQNANVNLNKYDKRLDSYNGKVTKYKTTIDRLKDGGWASDAYEKNVQAVKNAVHEYETLLNKLKGKDASLVTSDDISKLDEYEKKIKNTIATVTNMSASEKGYNLVSGQKELDKIHKLLNENSKMSSEAKAKIRAYYAEIESGNPSMSLDKIHGEIMKIYNAEVEAGRAGKSFFDTLKNSGFHQLAAQMAGMFGFYDVINLGKEAISTIVSLDDALVDLKKTTAMNKTQLEDFYYDANDVAKQMGVTTEEIITQASAWSRLGYSSQEAATTMAKLSSKFASISPGMSTDEAQEGLVSIMKAFDIDPDDVETEIMDKVNVLGNKFAEENQDVIEGLKRSAAAMSAMGQSFTDTAALFTGGMEILQDSESMGTALRTLSMRVRGYDEETNQLSDDLVNVTGEVADLTKTAQDSQGVSLFTDATQEHYRSMVEYLGDIADRWDQISEKNQTELLQKLFGKNRANAGAAIIQNFDQVRAAIEAMDESAGSSEAEMSAIESSLSYKINALKETWVGCVQDMIDRGDLGTIVTGLTKVSEAITFLLDKFGILGTIGLGAGIFSGIKNVGRDKMYSLSF